MRSILLDNPATDLTSPQRQSKYGAEQFCDAKAMKCMLTKMKTALDGGGRVTILVRHAERPALEPGDRTFGASLPLTANGWRDAQNFGIMLARELRPKSVAFYAGGTFRTLQTACGMAMGLDLAEAGARIERKVRLADFLGSESPFFGSVEERMSLAAQGHYHERLNDYFRNGVQRGYKPLKAAADIMEHLLAALHDDAWPLVVAVTHDINIAAFLAARGAVDSFTDDTWPGYLDAAIIVKTLDGQPDSGLNNVFPSVNANNTSRTCRIRGVAQ